MQAYIAAMPEWKSDLGRRLDDLIVRTVPNVRKAVRWNSPWHGVEGMGWFVSYHVFTRYVKVTFLNGASLDPVPPGSSRQGLALDRPVRRRVRRRAVDVVVPAVRSYTGLGRVPIGSILPAKARRGGLDKLFQQPQHLAPVLAHPLALVLAGQLLLVESD